MPVRCCSSLSTLTTASRFLLRLGERFAFGGHVAVVEGVERGAELLDELERHAGAVLGVLDRVGAVVPGPHGTAGAERVGEPVPRNVCQ